MCNIGIAPEGLDRILDKRPRTIFDFSKAQDTLCESVEQGGKSTAVDCHKSQEILSKSMGEGVENIQPTKFGYEHYEGEPHGNYKWILRHRNSY